MLKHFGIIFLVFNVLVASLFSQIKVQKSETYKITSEKEFNQNSLWGYINGGADIYLEYGFQHLLVQEVDCESEKIKIEVYRMVDSKSAYGIFSLNSNPSEIKSIDLNFSSVNKYHLQAVLGSSYISIINTSGTELAQKCSENILKGLQIQNSEQIFHLPELIEKLWKKENIKIKLLKAKLSFENHASEFEFLSEKIGVEDKYYISFPAENGTKTILIIPNLSMSILTQRLEEENVNFSVEEDHSIHIFGSNSFSYRKINDKDIIIYKIKTDWDEFIKLIGK